MRLIETQALSNFRAEVRAWLEQNIPRQARAREGPEMREFDMAWQKTQYGVGWAGISCPRNMAAAALH